MAFAKMVNMARTADDVKKEVADYPTSIGRPTVSTYPYGLCISLDQDVLKKLGLDGDLPQIGEILNFNAIAKVTAASTNESEDTDGKKTSTCRVELQITDMGIPGASEADRSVERSEVRRKRFYGDTMESADAD